MEHNFKKGDIVISDGFKLNSHFSPFWEVSKFSTRISNRKKKKQHILTFKGGHFTMNAECYRLATEEDYLLYDKIKKSVKTIETDDETQHISSVSGEEKLKYKDELHAYRAAFRMCYKEGGEWVVYKCTVCDEWHIGKDKQITMLQKDVKRIKDILNKIIPLADSGLALKSVIKEYSDKEINEYKALLDEAKLFLNDLNNTLK